jgi:Mg-chelatase subunit ChlI
LSLEPKAIRLKPRKILVMGLHGAGKAKLTRALAPMLKAVVFNAGRFAPI